MSQIILIRYTASISGSESVVLSFGKVRKTFKIFAFATNFTRKKSLRWIKVTQDWETLTSPKLLRPVFPFEKSAIVYDLVFYPFFVPNPRISVRFVPEGIAELTISTVVTDFAKNEL